MALLHATSASPGGWAVASKQSCTRPSCHAARMSRPAACAINRKRRPARARAWLQRAAAWQPGPRARPLTTRAPTPAHAHLPQELAAADEGRGVLELPAHHVGPLVQSQRQVAVAADPLGVVGVHDLRCGGCVGGGGRQVEVPAGMTVAAACCAAQLQRRTLQAEGGHAQGCGGSVGPWRCRECCGPVRQRRGVPSHTVSLVGRMAMGFSICVLPALVTQATSGAKPSTWSFSAAGRQAGARQGGG